MSGPSHCMRCVGPSRRRQVVLVTWRFLILVQRLSPAIPILSGFRARWAVGFAVVGSCCSGAGRGGLRGAFADSGHARRRTAGCRLRALCWLGLLQRTQQRSIERLKRVRKERLQTSRPTVIAAGGAARRSPILLVLKSCRLQQTPSRPSNQRTPAHLCRVDYSLPLQRLLSPASHICYCVHFGGGRT